MFEIIHIQSIYVYMNNMTIFQEGPAPNQGLPLVSRWHHLYHHADQIHVFTQINTFQQNIQRVPTPKGRNHR